MRSVFAKASKKSVVAAALSLCLMLGFAGEAAAAGGMASFPAVKTASGAAEQAEPVRAVTYAGHEWVINFWSSETEYMAEDFQRIREDGFNTVILCVPWREFQPYVTGGSFNGYAFEKLKKVCQGAGEAGLSVMLRLGYTWDYYDNSDILLRYRKLIYDESYRSAWKRYAREVYQTVSAYDNFAGAFLTWEDFWNFIDVEKQLAGTYAGRQLAKDCGYTDYVRTKVSKEERELLYGDPEKAEAAEFPAADSPAYRLFFDWYNTVLMDLLSDTQDVFPGISMECRLDQDPYPMPDGSLNGYDHAVTFPCGTAAYSSVMLSATMGFANGLELSAAQAAAMSRGLLDRAKQASGKPVFVDQFLYMETTPGYEYLPHLRESEVNSYLSAMGDVFRKETLGYGLWTYRDYADSIIYNSEFGLDLKGWQARGSVSITEYDGSRMAALSKGGSLSQDISYRTYLGSGNTMLSLRAVSEAPVHLTVKVGDCTESVEVNGDETVTVTFPKRVAESFQIYADGNVLLDNIKLYTHVTEGRVYGLDGSEGAYLSGVRALNARLSR